MFLSSSQTEDKPQQPARKWNMGIYFQKLSNFLFIIIKESSFWLFLGSHIVAAERRIRLQLPPLCKGRE